MFELAVLLLIAIWVAGIVLGLFVVVIGIGVSNLAGVAEMGLYSLEDKLNHLVIRLSREEKILEALNYQKSKIEEAFVMGRMMKAILDRNPRLHTVEILDIAKSVHYWADRYAFDPLLILAVIVQESDCRPRAIGGSGEVGLMQVRPMTHEFIDPDKKGSLFEPDKNIEIGVRYLDYCREVTKKYAGGDKKKNLKLALAAYNLGHNGAVSRLESENRYLPMFYAVEVLMEYFAMRKGG